jgi:hypothetical protein
MALAILQFQDSDETESQFKINIGTNQFYLYTIGQGESRRNGILYIQDIVFTSELIGPLAPESLGCTILKVPNDRFTRKHRSIQITSFRTAQRQGMAISEIVSVDAVGAMQNHPVAMSFQIEGESRSITRQPIQTVAFSYQEAQPLSSAMMFEWLTALIPKILPAVKAAVPVVAGALPTVLPIIGQLINSGSQTAQNGKTENSQTENNQTGTGQAQLSQIISDPTTAKLIQDLLLQATGTRKNQQSEGSTKDSTKDSNNAAANPSSLADLAQHIATLIAANGSKVTDGKSSNGKPSNDKPSSANVEAQSAQLSLVGGKSRTYCPDAPDQTDPYRIARPVATPIAPPPRAQAQAFQYAEAMVLPAALLEALPALLPLLEKVLTPETIKALAENMPTNKLLGAVTDGLKEIGRANSEAQKNTLDTLKEIMPRIDTPEDRLFEELSLGLASPSVALDYQRIDAVKLQFIDRTTLMLQGRSRVVYRQDQAIALPLVVTTPRLIENGTIQLLVKDPTTLEILIEQKYRVATVTSGPLSVVPTLSPEQLKALAPNEEYLVCAVLLWTGRSQQTKQPKRIGTSIAQLVTVMGEYRFDRLDDAIGTVPLNDVDHFRPYWHKVWQMDIKPPLRRIHFDCKYYYTLEGDRTELVRLETLTQLAPDGETRQTGRMKTGLILSLNRLNELLPQCSQYPTLSAAELSALRGTETKLYFNYAARTSVEFIGHKQGAVALWVYPEVKLQRIILKQVTQTNANGQVLELSEHPVVFPMPAIAHFIGVSTLA